MSSHLYTYIGPYAKVPVSEKLLKIERYICPDVSCKNHRRMHESNQFCPLCGAKGTMHVEEKKSVLPLVSDYYEFAEDNKLEEDAFFSPEEKNDLWLPNIKFKGFSVTLDDSDEENHQEITSEMIEDSKKEFIKKFKKQIDKFEEVYNQKLEINFGYVCYYM